MTSRERASFLRGMGSVLDLGGTTYKRTRIQPVRKGSPASDRRALAKDVKVAVRAATADSRRRLVG